jgi:hypothetical protein
MVNILRKVEADNNINKLWAEVKQANAAILLLRTEGSEHHMPLIDLPKSTAEDLHKEGPF